MHTTSNETTQTSNMTSSSANNSDCCRSGLASSSDHETASACAPECGICDKSCRLESANPSGDGAASPTTHGADPCFATSSATLNWPREVSSELCVHWAAGAAVAAAAAAAAAEAWEREAHPEGCCSPWIPYGLCH